MRHYKSHTITVAIILLVTTNLMANDSTRHHFSLLAGHAAYMSSFSVPSGLQGKSATLLYDYTRTVKNSSNRLFYLSSRLDFSNLKKERLPYTTDYLYACLDAGANWLWKIPVESNLNIHIGTGTAFNIYIASPKVSYPSYPYFTPYYNWGITLNFTSRLQYSFKRFSLKNHFSMPMVKAGFFPEYYYINENDRYFALKPNTITSLGEYRYIDNRISISMPYKEVKLSLSYLFIYQHSDVNQNKERYLQHYWGVGVSF